MTEIHSYLSKADYPLLHQEVAEVEAIYSALNLTVSGIESALREPEYEAVEFLPFKDLSRKQKAEIKVAEEVTAFGRVLGGLFEQLLLSNQRLPTQTEFAESGVRLVKEWWNVEQPEGLEWTATVEQAIYNRQLRSYTSHLVELHTLLSLRRIFPKWNIYCADSIDLLMGVDLVIETEKKRLYIHVFKNSEHGFNAFQAKRRRGGTRNSAGKFIKYQRDFSGDKSLQYDWRQSQCSESTQFINGNPLFKAEYLETQLSMFDKFKQFGFELSDYSKLQYLEQFLQKLEAE